MNWSIKYVCAAMIGFIFCIHSTRAQDKSGLPGLDPSFPWAKVMLDKQDEIFTLRHVEADVAATINLSPELQGLPWGKKVPEKDGAANNKKLGLTETVAKNKIDPNNPQQKGETLLDLTSYPATISYGLATLVDDVTEITVIDITENPENKTALFVHKHNGTALWSVDRSFKTSKNKLPGARKYKLKYKYWNRVHLEHDPFEDWDGLSVYLITMSDIPVLQLTDQLTKESKTDSTNDMNDAPLLYCPINDDGNGDVEIAIVEGIKDGQSFEWKIVKGDKTEASGNLNKDNEYKATRNDLSVGSYELNVSEKGRHPRKINLVVFRVDMGRILKGAAEHKDKLVVGEDYIFEYTLEPSGITLPNLRFCIAHSVKSGSKGVRVHSADLKKVTSGLHTETWKNTKWTVTHDGAYANPKNGEYSAFCVYPYGYRKECIVSNSKAFHTLLVIEAMLDDSAPPDGISSGLYQPDKKSWGSTQVEIGLKPDKGGIVIGKSKNLSFTGKSVANMDNDSDSGDKSGNEIRRITARQIMQHVNNGKYTVVIKGLRDVAGNNGPGGPGGEIKDWTIRLE